MSTKNKLYHSSEGKTYLLNGAQILSMTAMSFGIPLIIGIEEYGKYAALFSIPATLSVFMQGLYISCVGKCDYAEFRSGAMQTNIALTLAGFIAGFLVLGTIQGFLTAIIFAVLIERFRCEAMALMQTHGRYISTLRDAELISVCITVFALGVAYLLGYCSYLLPILILLAGLVVSIYKLKRIIPAEAGFVHLKLANAKKVLSAGSGNAFVRIHEELFVTIMPYLLSVVLGNREAGVFRLTISVVKFFFKAFPYRYETVIADFVHRPPDTPAIKKYFIYLNGLAICLAGLIGATHFAFPRFLLLESIDIWILASAGFQAVTSIFSPLLVLYRPRYYSLIIAGFLLTAIVLICYGYRSFQVTFVVIHLILCFQILRFLQDSRQGRLSGEVAIRSSI